MPMIVNNESRLKEEPLYMRKMSKAYSGIEFKLLSKISCLNELARIAVNIS
jgi:hypothetical protein